MATSKLVIKKRYIKKSGFTPIYIQYIFKSDEKLLINTGIEILPIHWNANTQSIKEGALDFYNKNFSVLNFELSNILNLFKSFLSNAFTRKITPTIKYVKDHFNQYIIYQQQSSQVVPNELVSLYDHIIDYIECKKNKVIGDTIKDYNALIKHLKYYEKTRGQSLSFTSFTYNFYEDFIDFLYFETIKPNGGIGLLTNSVGKQIKNLKAFLRDRIRKGYCADIDLSNFKTVTEEVDRIYLSWQEISLLYNFNVQNNIELDKTKDLLVLGCLLGLRFSDLSRICPEFIQNNYLRIRQKKVKKIVQIPILNEALSILQKYNMYAPNLPLYEFNKNLKTLGKLVGLNANFEMTYHKNGKEFNKTFKKYELMSSHICRRSFCTNEYLDGTDIHLIMRISGHKTERAFLTYLKMDEVVASQKIAEKWKTRARL